MICTSIGRGRHRMLIAEHKHLAEQGAHLVELRLDYIRRSVNIGRLLDDRPCPTIVTCRRPHEGGKWMRSEEDRLVLLRTAIANTADYVDLESDIAGKIPRYGDTKRIISYHNFHETPEDLEAIHEMMCRLDPDVIKIATMANNPIDNIRTLQLCRSKKFPTVAFCMGEMGLPSRILCGKFGAPFTYATFNTERIMAPGQLTNEQLINDFNYEKINADTTVLGVIADPVKHSLSPVIHNACLRKEGMNSIYLPFRVPAEYLDEFMERAREIDITGLSVTIPHKQAILKHINALDDLSAGIKAANTIIFRGQGTLGYNTDCNAALDSLQEALPPAEDGRPFNGLRVLILGSGGVARTVGFGLHREGADVSICTRDYRKSDALATELQCKSVDWAGRANAEYDLLVNGTSVGMHPNLDESPYEAKWFRKTAVVFDCVYNPEQTLFIKHARAAGCVTVTGVDMFARQAARQFKLFTGKDADLELIRTEVKRSISAARYTRAASGIDEGRGSREPIRIKADGNSPLFLIGLRGTGKTTVGKLLAERLDFQWFDSDLEIEAQESRIVAQIFKQDGEERFRAMESKLIVELVSKVSGTEEKDKTGKVISLGGGAILSESIRKLLGRRGKCVWLHATHEAMSQRMTESGSRSTRPALTDKNFSDEITHIMERRRPIYSGCADYDVDTTELSPEQVVDRIARWLQVDDKVEE